MRKLPPISQQTKIDKEFREAKAISLEPNRRLTQKSFHHPNKG
jgi:hypothetical protein